MSGSPFTASTCSRRYCPTTRSGTGTWPTTPNQPVRQHLMAARRHPRPALRPFQQQAADSIPCTVSHSKPRSPAPPNSAGHFSTSSASGSPTIRAWMTRSHAWSASCAVRLTAPAIQRARPHSPWQRTPELNSSKSLSIPSLKITPFSGINERMTSGDSRRARPQTKASPAWQRSETARERRTADTPHPREAARNAVPGCWLQKFAAIWDEPVTMLFSHAVEPNPVDTMMPLEDCDSWIFPSVIS